jgi:thiol-disulfide isomerase/thioredoxin
MIRLIGGLYLILFTATFTIAQDYRYSLTVNGLTQPSSVYFGYWYGQNAFVIDSAQVKPGHASAEFTGQRQWPTGLYFWGLSGYPNTVNFVINGEQDMLFSTHVQAPNDSIRVQRSRENEPYFDWLRYEREAQTNIRLAEESLSMLRRATKDRTVWMEQIARINGLAANYDSIARHQVKLYPDLFYPKMVLAERNVALPRDIAPRQPDGTPNPAFQHYIQSHFWDNFDFSDERMMQTPVLPRKMDQWINIQPSELDTVKLHLRRLMEKASANDNLRQLTIELLIERFDQPSVGGNETMLVYLFDQFGRTATQIGLDTADWMRLEYKVSAYRYTLPGLIAPDFALFNEKDSLITLSELPAKYTILYFFSPLCTHCQELTPKVYETTLPYLDKGLQVVSVTTDHRKEVWTNYVTQNLKGWTCLMDMMEPSLVEEKYATHNLPNLLLLDENKRILARRLPADQLNGVLEQLFRVN